MMTRNYIVVPAGESRIFKQEMWDFVIGSQGLLLVQDRSCSRDVLRWGKTVGYGLATGEQTASDPYTVSAYCGAQQNRAEESRAEHWLGRKGIGSKLP